MTNFADEAQALLERTRRERTTRDKAARYSRTARAASDLASGGRFLYQLSAGLSWVYRTMRPLGSIGLTFTQWCWARYRYLWALVVYQKMADGELLFSKTRAGIMVLLSALWFWFLLCPIAQCVFIDAPLYLLTAKVDERIYLSKSQELDAVTNSHAVQGWSDAPFTDQDAMYFRTENSLFNNLWSIWHGRGFFFPEYVAAVPSTPTRCIITVYGFRFRFTTRFLNIYPEILATACSAPMESRT